MSKFAYQNSADNLDIVFFQRNKSSELSAWFRSSNPKWGASLATQQIDKSFRIAIFLLDRKVQNSSDCDVSHSKIN
ncbi:hypothetical protein NDA01_05970 [Trichocoleus desertorum AS-A10]|uniref:hypothetical protein n=1 Tax=Trichocoleus desertorum TaxID=1481672 RepID=UPI00329A381F